MKEFTEKDIDMFLDYIKDGILASDEIAGDPAMANYVAENVYKELTEHVIDNLDLSKLANYIDKSFWSEKLFDNHVVPFCKELNKLVAERAELPINEKLDALNIEVNRKSLARILGLREWATKEDIINEINNLL